MYPSARNPVHDSRWTTSGRAASLGTVLLNVALGLLYILVQSAPVAQTRSQPLTLELRLPPAAAPSPELPPPPVRQPPQTAAVPPPPSPPPKPAQPLPRRQPPPPPPKAAKARQKPPPPRPQPATPATAPVESAPSPAQPSAATATVAPTPPPAATTGAEPVDMPRILADLVSLIKQYQDYPKAARRAGYEGVVVMTVFIDRGGVITGWDLNRASAHPILDRAAEKTFEKLRGKRIRGVEEPGGLRVVVPVRYTLRERG